VGIRAGFGRAALKSDLKTPGVGLQIGVESGRIDVLTKVSGVAAKTSGRGGCKPTFANSVRCNVIGTSNCFKINELQADLRTLRTSRRSNAIIG